MANGVAASAYMFDTHDFVKRLTSAGLPTEAAEVFAKEQSRLISKIASKDDLKTHASANKKEFEHAEMRIDSKFDLLRKDNELLRKDIAAMETRSDAKFDVLRAEMSAIKSEFTTMRWVLGAIATGVISLLIKGFLKL